MYIKRQIEVSGVRGMMEKEYPIMTNFESTPMVVLTSSTENVALLNDIDVERDYSEIYYDEKTGNWFSVPEMGNVSVRTIITEKIKTSVLIDLRIALQEISSNTRTESCVFILRDSKGKQFIAVPEYQELTGAHYTVSIPAIKHMFVHYPDATIIGEFHSHPFGVNAGMFSGEDQNSVEKMNGRVYGNITYSNVSKEFGGVNVRVPGIKGFVDHNVIFDEGTPDMHWELDRGVESLDALTQEHIKTVIERTNKAIKDLRSNFWDNPVFAKWHASWGGAGFGGGFSGGAPKQPRVSSRGAISRGRVPFEWEDRPKKRDKKVSKKRSKKGARTSSKGKTSKAVVQTSEKKGTSTKAAKTNGLHQHTVTPTTRKIGYGYQYTPQYTPQVTYTAQKAPIAKLPNGLDVILDESKIVSMEFSINTVDVEKVKAVLASDFGVERFGLAYLEGIKLPYAVKEVGGMKILFVMSKGGKAIEFSDEKFEFKSIKALLEDASGVLFVDVLNGKTAFRAVTNHAAYLFDRITTRLSLARVFKNEGHKEFLAEMTSEVESQLMRSFVDTYKETIEYTPPSYFGRDYTSGWGRTRTFAPLGRPTEKQKIDKTLRMLARIADRAIALKGFKRTFTPNIMYDDELFGQYREIVIEACAVIDDPAKSVLHMDFDTDYLEAMLSPIDAFDLKDIIYGHSARETTFLSDPSPDEDTGTVNLITALEMVSRIVKVKEQKGIQPNRMCSPFDLNDIIKNLKEPFKKVQEMRDGIGMFKED